MSTIEERVREKWDRSMSAFSCILILARSLDAMEERINAIELVNGDTLLVTFNRVPMDDLKKFYGLPPYHGGGNPCRGDGHFAKTLEETYGMRIEELKKQTGFDKLLQEWNDTCLRFAGR